MLGVRFGIVLVWFELAARLEDRGFTNTQTAQGFGGNAVSFSDEPEQDMLGEPLPHTLKCRLAK